ncbi:MAG: GNAT family N-acetyltransferase [Chloroflexota bacterium]|nr:GNAT family N-acetyltransferase [Chloroflexota bacterium]
MTRYEVADLRLEDHDTVYRFLSQDAYWSQGLPREIFDTALKGSLTFAAYASDANDGERGALADGERTLVDGPQTLAGFARVVTDRATFAWLCDVFVLPEHRGHGVSKQIMDSVMAEPNLARVRNFMLATRDAHRLYARYGFAPLAEPARWMVIRRPYR